MGNEQKMATPKQLAYLERLGGMTMDQAADMTMSKASVLIAELTRKANNGQGAIAIKPGNANRRNDFGNGARLGMAFKCCYRRWVSGGKNIFKYRNDFIQNVLDTFDLINEIAEKALEVPA